MVQEMNNDHIKVKGCGCRYRGQECDHLCDQHRDEFILQQYNYRHNIREWLKIHDEIEKEMLKDNS